MKLLKLNAIPVVMLLAGIGFVIFPLYKEAEWRRVSNGGELVPGKITAGRVVNKRRSLTDEFQLEVAYGKPGGRRTTRTFTVSEEFYAKTLRTSKPVVFLAEPPKAQVRCNPDAPAEAWLVGAEPEEPSPTLWMIGGAVLMGGGVWYFLSLKQSGKLFRDSA